MSPTKPAPFKMLLTVHSAQNLPTGGLCMMYLGETALTSSAQEDSAWTTHKSFHTKWQPPLATGADVVWNQRYSVGVKRPSIEVLTVRIKDKTMETLVTTAIPLKQFTFDENVLSSAPLFKHGKTVGNLRFEVHIMYNNPPKEPEPPRPTRAASCPPMYQPPPPSYPSHQPPVRPPPPQPVRQSTISPAVTVGAATGLAHLLSSFDPTGLSRMLPLAAAMLSSRGTQRSSSSGSIPAQNPLVDYFMMRSHSSNYDPNGTIFASLLQQQNAGFNSQFTPTSSLFQGLNGSNYSSGDNYTGYDFTGGGDCTGGFSY